jgi:hypothetical protein
MEYERQPWLLWCGEILMSVCEREDGYPDVGPEQVRDYVLANLRMRKAASAPHGGPAAALDMWREGWAAAIASACRWVDAVAREHADMDGATCRILADRMERGEVGRHAEARGGHAAPPPQGEAGPGRLAAAREGGWQDGYRAGQCHAVQGQVETRGAQGEVAGPPEAGLVSRCPSTCDGDRCDRIDGHKGSHTLGSTFWIVDDREMQDDREAAVAVERHEDATLIAPEGYTQPPASPHQGSAEPASAPSQPSALAASWWPTTVDRIECDACAYPLQPYDQVRPVAWAHVDCPTDEDGPPEPHQGSGTAEPPESEVAP